MPGFEQTSGPAMQAERDDKKWVDMEKQAVLAAQAAALRAKMTESHLAKFRTEARNRCWH
jgi:hypothetical protein